MTEDMEKRVEEERKESAYMKDLNDGEFLHELSYNNDYVFKRVNEIISKLSSIDTLKEERDKEKTAYVGLEFIYKTRVGKLEAENKELKEESKKHWRDNQDTLRMLDKSEDNEMALYAKLKKAEKLIQNCLDDTYDDIKENSFTEPEGLSEQLSGILKSIRGEQDDKNDNSISV